MSIILNGLDENLRCSFLVDTIDAWIFYISGIIVSLVVVVWEMWDKLDCGCTYISIGSWIPDCRWAKRELVLCGWTSLMVYLALVRDRLKRNGYTFILIFVLSRRVDGSTRSGGCGRRRKRDWTWSLKGARERQSLQ